MSLQSEMFLRLLKWYCHKKEKRQNKKEIKSQLKSLILSILWLKDNIQDGLMLLIMPDKIYRRRKVVFKVDIKRSLKDWTGGLSEREFLLRNCVKTKMKSRNRSLKLPR